MINFKHTGYRSLILQLCRFGIVGVTAALVHFSVVVELVQSLAMLPLSANVLGFLTAFQVSYWGHRLWTFQGTGVFHRDALLKLLCVQCSLFAANELLFYIFLQLQLPYPLALAIVLTVLPIFTFTASKLWVFKN